MSNPMQRATLVALLSLSLAGCVVPAGTLAELLKDGPSPASSPSPAPGTSPVPGTSPAPVASASPGTPAALGPITGKVLYHDGFERGLENWYVKQGRGLQLKSVIGGAAEGNAAVAFADEDDRVTPGSADSANLVFRTRLDLSGTALPRMRFSVQGGAEPAIGSSVQVVWLDQPSYELGMVELWTAAKLVGNAARGGASWQARDVDLSAFKSKPGFVRLLFEVTDVNTATYAGLRVDDVTIYDAGAPGAGATAPTAAAVSDEAPFDTRLVGSWELWIPGAVNNQGQASPGAGMGTLTIRADQSYVWTDRGAVRGQGQLGIYQSVRNKVSDGSSDFYVKPSADGITLYSAGYDTFTATGKRAP